MKRNAMRKQKEKKKNRNKFTCIADKKISSQDMLAKYSYAKLWQTVPQVYWLKQVKALFLNKFQSPQYYFGVNSEQKAHLYE